MAAAEPAAVGGPADKGSGGTDTPALRQYQLAKREHPDCLVLFRLGDFFEVFGQDAIQAAPILGVTLTSRAFGRRGRMPMCGVPQQSLAGYARKLLDAGLRVAVCDQTESARPGGNWLRVGWCASSALGPWWRSLCSSPDGRSGAPASTRSQRAWEWLCWTSAPGSAGSPPWPASEGVRHWSMSWPPWR